MPLMAALDAAAEAGLDLVEVSPNQEVPVCKIIDYGKLRYDTHDYEVKTRSMSRFFEDGDKVKVTLRFRGREMAHQHLGMELLQKVKQEFDEVAKVELEPKLEGRQMTMVMAPR